MTTMRRWAAPVIGGLLATGIGTSLVASIAFAALAEPGWSIMALYAYLICFWGCTPALLVPLIGFSIARRVSSYRVIVGSAVAGMAFPAVLGAVLYVLPHLFRIIKLDVASEFTAGNLDVDDVSFWIALLPVAVVVGVGIAHLALGRAGKEPA